MTDNLMAHDPNHESPFQRIRRVNDAGNDNHFVDVTEMIGIGKGEQP